MPVEKQEAIKYVVPLIPKNITKVVSPFLGGGSIEVYLTNLDIKIEGYDIFKPLMIFWKELIHDNKNFVEFRRTIQATEENYKIVKEKLMEWEYTQEMLERLANKFLYKNAD